MPCYSVFFAPNGEHVLLAQTDPDHSISNIPPGAGLLFFHKDGSQQYWEEHDTTWGLFLKRRVLRMLGAEKPWIDWTITTDASHTGIVTVNTNQGEEFDFDFTTGGKVRTESVWNVGLAIFFVMIPLLSLRFLSLWYFKVAFRRWSKDVSVFNGRVTTACHHCIRTTCSGEI